MGVEFIVDAGLWHQTNAGPPVLMGHLTQHVGSPNRYALNAFYELHVWAWKENLDLGYELAGSLNLSPPVTEKTRFTK